MRGPSLGRRSGEGVEGEQGKLGGGFNRVSGAPRRCNRRVVAVFFIVEYYRQHVAPSERDPHMIDPLRSLPNLSRLSPATGGCLGTAAIERSAQARGVGSRARRPRTGFTRAVSTRTGFTLVELLVVIAIIGILVSLLLPAVNASRNAARKIICASNLRQAGLAVLEYEQTNKHFPVAGLVDRPADDPCGFNQDCFDPDTGQRISWVVLILPFLEEQTLFDQFDFRKTIFEQERLPQSRSIASLICPADAATGRFLQYPDLTRDIPFAKANVAAYATQVHVGHLEHIPGVLGGFTPGHSDGPPIKRLEDGTTHTIMVTEVRTRDEPSDQRGAWALPWPGSTLLSLDVHHDTARCKLQGSILADISLVNPYCAQTSDYWAGVAQLPNRPAKPGQYDTIYKCLQPESAARQNMPCGPLTGRPRWLSAAPRSAHVGGVNACMVDGRVTFVSDEVDHVTMAYLISINDGRVLDYAERL